LHFWDAEFDLYKDENFQRLQTVFRTTRGQKAKYAQLRSTSCAYDAYTSTPLILNGPLYLLASNNFALRQAALAGGEIWEHYTKRWQVRPGTTSRKTQNIYFAPWGIPTQAIRTEWAKLLL